MRNVGCGGIPNSMAQIPVPNWAVRAEIKTV